MRAFVTGATGFLGSHLVRALLARGDSVVAMVRDPRKAASLPPGAQLHTGDLTDQDALDQLRGPFDAIFHLGAAISGDWPYHQRVTVDGTRTLMRFAAECGLARVVLVSSLAVYDKKHLKPYDTINEASKTFLSLEDGGPYAWGKLLAERLVADESAQRGLEYVIARPGLIYGHGHLTFGHLGPKVGPLRFPIGGSSVRLPLAHVDSVVDALIRMAELPGLNGHIFNIVDDEQPTKAAYAQALSRVSGQKVRTIGIPAGPFIGAARVVQRLKSAGKAKWLPGPTPEKIRSRTVECRYDCAALRSTLGWKPARPLEDGIARSLSSPTVRAPAAVERVGIIGAGRMADFHILALRRIPGVQITGVLDARPDAARAVAQRHAIPLATGSADEFYAQAKPQSVHILTPPQSHAALALDAVSRGCHVLLEKPLAITPEECDALARAAHQQRVTIGVNHNYVTDTRIQRARALIASGAIGELVHIDLTWGFDIRRFSHALPAADGKPTWAMELPGGLLEDLLPHPLSIALALATEEVLPRSWHTFRSGRLPFACQDEVRLLLAGRHATVNVNVSLSSKPDDLHLTIYGTSATLKLDVNNMIFTRSRLIKGPKALSRGLSVITGHALAIAQTARNVLLMVLKRADPPASVANLVREHYAALTAGRPLPTDLAQGRRTVEIMRQLWPASPAPEPLETAPSRLNAIPSPQLLDADQPDRSTLIAVETRTEDGTP